MSIRTRALAAVAALLLPVAITAAPAAAAPQSGLTNMGFEQGMTGWQTGTVVQQVTVTGPDGFNSPYEGASMARLGTPKFSGQPIGPNELYQDFVVDSPSESFVYNVFTYDYTGFDEFRFSLQVVDPATGEILAAHQQGAWGSGTSLKTTGWQFVSLNLGAHMGKTVRLLFSAGGTLDTLYSLWAYLDSADSGAPPDVATAPTGGAQTGSVTTDPQTGQITVSMVAWDKSPLTLNTIASCPNGSTPSAVTLLLNGAQYPMSPTGGGGYGVTLSAGQVQDGVLAVSVVCGAQTFVDAVGQIQLFDPSGFLTDAVTGAPVAGASVTLFVVPGWTAETAPDSDPTTCQSNATKPAAGWNQPAPTTGFVQANPYAVPQMMSPKVNPFISTPTGYYGWDVAAGCYFVRVAKPGYQTLTSPVVGVPTEVTDLHLKLTPVAVPSATCGGQPATIVITTPNQVTMGTEGKDVIVGTNGADTIFGLGGNDIICGLGGNDVIDAGAGADVVYGGAGADTLLGGIGNDILFGQQQNDYLNGGGGNDFLFGGGQNDKLDGHTHDDVLVGGSGDDELIGNYGTDDCRGGPGIDTAETCEIISGVP